ncbi:Methyltransferase domain-containing protein [Verrucomicrobium sp. GAS474]|uniref:class I SAM-dependent methyltransferase n=1 Tax=Verrucomicrobium sp. GAS474 TaxID=1882831 RepID=UPI00087BD76B|nr:class I SAM-dependent methyltransferase [Verrucomicrobium sp. GAS474]SDT85798.1 Methyltransferase domain-containing protein [Verrucomicrobium sp. GAS474]
MSRTANASEKEAVRHGRQLHWSHISTDYLEYRPTYPRPFFDLLRLLGVGVPKQALLDLGCGTGALAVPLALRGAHVTGIDLSEEQIAAAQEAARRADIRINFQVASAERTGLPDHGFDAITASMCWGYFDKKKVIPEILRLLRPGGLLVIASLIWTDEGDLIAARTNELIRRHNPAFRTQPRAGGDVDLVPEWSKKHFRLRTFQSHRTTLPFTSASWRGRIRASRWIGAALSLEETAKFDREHRILLEETAAPCFDIAHDIRLQIFEVLPPA